MGNERRADQSYDVSVFQMLTDELATDDPKVAERKIKRMLRRKHLGEYAQNRIDSLRSLRNDLRTEIRKFEKSSYYQGAPQLSPTEHFDDQRMVKDFSIRYPLVRHPDIGGVIGYALYYYYLR